MTDIHTDRNPHLPEAGAENAIDNGFCEMPHCHKAGMIQSIKGFTRWACEGCAHELTDAVAEEVRDSRETAERPHGWN